MRYELRKNFCNKVVVMMILIFLCINGLEASYKGKFVEREDDEYTTVDYDRLVEEAFASIEEGRDVRLSSVFIENFANRELTTYTYETEEAAFVEYSTYAEYGLILVILITIVAIEAERKSKMTQIISVASKRNTRIILSKQLAIVVSVIIINLAFLLETILVHNMVGEIDYGMKLYNIPGYRGTLFNGSILEYKILCTLGICLIQIIMANVVYILACVIKKGGALITGSVATYAVLDYISSQVPLKYYYLNLFAFFDSKYLMRDTIAIFIGDIYTIYIWVALVFLLLMTVGTNLCSFLMYRERRTI